MGKAVGWREFSSSEALAKSLAEHVSTELALAIYERDVGFLAVSGGTTPVRFFQALSKMRIEWTKVTITLVDERFVPPTSPRSNERLVREHLLQGEAAHARFIGLYRDEATIESAAEMAWRGLADLPWPLDVAMLGMGADGHTASFFPDATDLGNLLSPENKALVLPVHAPSAGEPRLTLPMRRIVENSLVQLHIEGTEKRAVLERALAGDRRLPVSSVLNHPGVLAEIYWCP